VQDCTAKTQIQQPPIPRGKSTVILAYSDHWQTQATVSTVSRGKARQSVKKAPRYQMRGPPFQWRLKASSNGKLSSLQYLNLINALTDSFERARSIQPSSEGTARASKHISFREQVPRSKPLKIILLRAKARHCPNQNEEQRVRALHRPLRYVTRKNKSPRHPRRQSGASSDDYLPSRGLTERSNNRSRV
jgi:hypothetical protein